MMKIFFIILFSSIFSLSQEYWLKVEHEVQAFTSFLELENGDIIALGVKGLYVYGAHIGFMSLYKVDKYGNTIWHKTYYLNSWELNASRLEKASDGSILLIVATNYNVRGFFSILKISTNGDVIWDRSYLFDFSSYDYYPPAEECYVKETSDGGYLALLSYSPTSEQPALFLMIKISSEGDILWVKDLASERWFYDFWKAENDNFIISMDAWDHDLMDFVPVLVKIDSNGNVVWAKTFFINGERAYLELLKVEEDGSMVFKAGGITSDGCYFRAYIKFSPSFVPII